MHSLRHTNASLLIADGTDVTTVAGLLGHSQPSTTLDTYSRAFDKNKKNASRRMQPALKSEEGEIVQILEELYIGNVRPGERGFKRNSQYSRALSESTDAADRLIAVLTDEQKKLFEEFIDIQREVSHGL